MTDISIIENFQLYQDIDTSTAINFNIYHSSHHIVMMNYVTLALALLLALLSIADTTRSFAKVTASKCYVADSIIHDGSDQNMLWKETGQRNHPSFGFASFARGYRKDWMVFVMQYKGKTVLQFAHKRDGKCQFLIQQFKDKHLSLTEPRKCRSDSISTRTMFTTSAGPVSRHINFFLTPNRMIGHSKKNLILTSRSDKKRMAYWRLNINSKKSCNV